MKVTVTLGRQDTLTALSVENMASAKTLFVALAAVVTASLSDATSAVPPTQCRKKVNFDGLNVYPIKVSQNENLLGSVRGKRPVWGDCSMYNLKQVVSLEYLTQTDEYAAHFNCPNPKNKFCDSDSTECFHGECSVELGEKDFCVSLGTDERSGNLNFNFVEGTCLPEFKPLDKAQMEGELIKVKLDVDSVLKRATATMGRLYETSRACSKGKMSTTQSKKSMVACHALKKVEADAHRLISDLQRSLATENPRKQAGIASLIRQEQEEVEKLKTMKAAAEEKRIKREEAVKNEAKKRIAADRLEAQKVATRQSMLQAEANKQRAKENAMAQENAELEQRKHKLLQAGYAKELELREAERLGRAADIKSAKAALESIMNKRAATERAESALANSAKGARTRMKALELEKAKTLGIAKRTELELKKAKLELANGEKARGEETSKLSIRKERMRDDVNKLKEETQKTEDRLLKAGMKPTWNKAFDTSDIDEQAQIDAQKQMEGLMQGFGAVLSAHSALRNNPPRIPVAQAAPQPQAINIVIGCGGGKNCNKKERKNLRTSKGKGQHGEKDPAVSRAVQEALKGVLSDRDMEDSDRLERRRLELEHDQRVQEMASSDVKKALDEKKSSEDKLEFLKAQLNEQRKVSADTKAELNHEKSTQASFKKKLDERKEKLQDLADSA